MDRQDAKPRRPSLLAGAEPSPANAGPAGSPRGRILADAAPAAGPPLAVGARTRRLVIPLLALAVIAGVGVWWLTSGTTPDTGSTGIAATTPADVHPVSAPASGAALIVDDTGAVVSADVDAGVPSAQNGEGAAATLPATGNAPASPFDALAASPAAETPAGPVSADNPFANISPGAPVVARAPLRPRARTSQAEDADLLSVLLGNIHGADGDGTSGLDALLAGMQAEPVGSSSAPQRNGRPLRVRSEQIQANLRECPPPNTPEGLRCRQEICEVYAGRDPACPAG